MCVCAAPSCQTHALETLSAGERASHQRNFLPFCHCEYLRDAGRELMVGAASLLDYQPFALR